MEPCQLCPRRCKVDRVKQLGFCGAGENLRVALVSLHKWEEPCLVGENGGLELLGRNGGGKWYFHYQPVDWKIGNYQLGSREDFERMCKKAESLGIGVIVDVVPNHTTPQKEKGLIAFITKLV